jgi:hypothetical protein
LEFFEGPLQRIFFKKNTSLDPVPSNTHTMSEDMSFEYFVKKLENRDYESEYHYSWDITFTKPIGKYHYIEFENKIDPEFGVLLRKKIYEYMSSRYPKRTLDSINIYSCCKEHSGVYFNDIYYVYVNGKYKKLKRPIN